MTHMTLPTHNLSYPQAHKYILSELKHIRRLAKAIASDGLLNPIRVSRIKTSKAVKYKIIDGRKRVAAIKLLELTGKRPRSLSRIPCIEIESAPAQVTVLRPALKTDAEFAKSVRQSLITGQSLAALAKRFDCDIASIQAVSKLGALHSQIRDYFESGHINLEQAAAFATIPNQQAQWRLLQELGPFAHAKTVIEAIAQGETVVELPDGNVMILPSRETTPAAYKQGNTFKTAA